MSSLHCIKCFLQSSWDSLRGSKACKGGTLLGHAKRPENRLCLLYPKVSTPSVGRHLYQTHRRWVLDPYRTYTIPGPSSVNRRPSILTQVEWDTDPGIREVQWIRTYADTGPNEIQSITTRASDTDEVQRLTVSSNETLEVQVRRWKLKCCRDAFFASLLTRWLNLTLVSAIHQCVTMRNLDAASVRGH